ncbi:hypothetical protein ACSBR1_014097 [Camellia fascicularis]
MERGGANYSRRTPHGRGSGGCDRGGSADQQKHYHHHHQYHGGGQGGGGTYTATLQPPQPPPQQWGPRPVQGQRGPYMRPPPRVRPTRQDSGEISDRGRGIPGRRGSGRACQPAPAPPTQSLSSPEHRPGPGPGPDFQILEQPPASSLPRTKENNLVPVRRPDKGGTHSIQSPKLLVNHFPVMFNAKTTIIHYYIDIKEEVPSKNRSAKIQKSHLRMIKDKLFSDDPSQFPLSSTAYDGDKNIFSAVELPTEKFKVKFSDGEGMKCVSYAVTIKEVKKLRFGKLKDYLSGKIMSIPRDILQGMDLVMKENPSRERIPVGQSFYPTTSNKDDDLDGGVTASKGFQHSLKPTSQGLALCLDYSVLAFHKRLPVIDFLKEHVWGFKQVNDMRRLRREVINALTGLKVRVTHRATNQKYIIVGLTDQNTRNISFDVEDREEKAPPKRVSLVEYFREKYNKEIKHKDIPCLDLGENNRINYVPMEFCILVEGQRFPREHLSRDGTILLKNMSLVPPKDRMNTICEMVQADDGPCGGNIAQNFGIQVNKNMTKVEGRVIGPPQLKFGASNGMVNVVRVDKEKCQWNLVGKSVVDGKPVKRWALLDFSSSDRFKLDHGKFVLNLTNRCQQLGIHMEHPLVYRPTGMRQLSDITKLRSLLESVISEANGRCQGRLQIIVCVMTRIDPGYKYLKWLSETQIGIITQCCLFNHANNANDRYFANLALKINAKLGGSNVELIEPLPRFEGEGHVMFVGADVNHPGARNSTCPSIAAVVATVNWPAANRYAARVCPQYHRSEKILNFGTMCLELIQAYARINKVKPQRIVVFRDGVSEGQFDMVLNEELFDLKKAIYEEHYRPTITLVVAQKRHQTRLFPEKMKDGGSTGNVPPGTVVDKKITHPFEFDFYLCSHYGSLGTSKPTHYYVLWDEHNFTSDQLQKLIYDLCFTFARCTKPVSLVPPVYYADLVAYRGRMFQEVMMEVSPVLVSSSSSSSSSSSVTSTSSLSVSSFDDKFYKLHRDLENIMFFV